MTPGMAQVRVVELAGGHASAYAGRVLADFGAQVTTLRRADQSVENIADIQLKILTQFLAMGKTCQEAAPSEVEDALANANVLLLGDDLPNLDAWGIDVDELAQRYPHLTITTVTPFGRTGPLAYKPATELTLQAMSGLLAMSGSASKEPLMRSLQQSKYAAGLNAAYTSLASVYASVQHETGTVIDIAQREVLSSELVLNQPTYSYIGAVQGRLPESKDIFFTGAPVRAADGLVTMQINNRTGVKSFASMLDEPRLSDPRFDSAEGRLTHSAELTQIVEEALETWEGRAFFETAASEGLLAGFVQTADKLLDCPQLAARNFWADLTVGETVYRVPDRLVNITRFHEKTSDVQEASEVTV